MNERIGKLAEQAGLLGPSSRIGNAHEATEKFAELIIQECIQSSNDLAKHYINNHPEQEQSFLLASIADYSNEIKKRFGVEG